MCGVDWRLLVGREDVRRLNLELFQDLGVAEHFIKIRKLNCIDVCQRLIVQSLFNFFSDACVDCKLGAVADL